MPRLAKRRKSEEARRRPSRMSRAILSRIASFINNVLQHIISNTRLAQTRSNEPPFVSNKGKPEDWFSNSVSVVVNVEGWNDVVAFSVSRSRKFSCNFGARTSQSGAKRLLISRSTDLYAWCRQKRLSTAYGRPSSLHLGTNSWHLAPVIHASRADVVLVLQWILSGISSGASKCLF